ncbi:MAG: copper homeostasis protein CutC [Bacteroidetes bacterium]|nr:copper homeostasis protein CutC [Bacteroidota bacterium]
MKSILEACVNSAISAVAAQNGGADRIELCENMLEGGCTPSAGTILFARQKLHIPIMVMIRPRGADFLYTDDEFEVMKHDIQTAKELGANGVVFGILKSDSNIDVERMGMLTEFARPMQVTCHRAFDMTADPFKALDDLIILGINRLLTSGQSDSALLGAPLIRELIQYAAGRILIMPGHGIKEQNLSEAIKLTGASEFHMYLTRKTRSSMKFFREDVKMGKPDLSEYWHEVVDEERIRKAKEIISS